MINWHLDYSINLAKITLIYMYRFRLIFCLMGLFLCKTSNGAESSTSSPDSSDLEESSRSSRYTLFMDADRLSIFSHSWTSESAEWILLKDFVCWYELRLLWSCRISSSKILSKDLQSRPVSSEIVSAGVPFRCGLTNNTSR